jgi:hypothetical protein
MIENLAGGVWVAECGEDRGCHVADVATGPQRPRGARPARPPEPRGATASPAGYLSRPERDFTHAEVGFELDATERRRRWLVKTLLRADGVDRHAWRTRFGSEVVDDFPQLSELDDRGWLTRTPTSLCLTEEGLARSDVVGPWLVSGPVWRAMGEYSLR